MEKADAPILFLNVVMGTRKSRYLLEQRCERRPASTPLSPPTHNLLERPIPSLELGASKQIKQEFKSEYSTVPPIYWFHSLPKTRWLSFKPHWKGGRSRPLLRRRLGLVGSLTLTAAAVAKESYAILELSIFDFSLYINRIAWKGLVRASFYLSM